MHSKDTLAPYLVEGALNHLSDLQGFRAVRNVELREGFVRNELVVPEGASNLFRNAHGGFSLVMIDNAACMAGYTLGKRVVTLQCNCNFMRPVLIGAAMAVEATVVHAGKTTIVVRVEVLDDQDVVCVASTVTLYAVGAVAESDPVPQSFFPRNGARVDGEPAGVVSFEEARPDAALGAGASVSAGAHFGDAPSSKVDSEALRPRVHRANLERRLSA